MAESKRDYYEVLGVSKDADDSTIKKAYRVLAKKYHPDMNPGDKEAEAKFKEASEAYAVLIDPDKRKKYDQFGHAAFDGSAGAGGFDFNGADMGDIFGDIFGDLFGGGFGGFGGRGRAANAPMKGENVRTSVRITFDEAMKGVQKEVTLNLKDTCSCCGGTGAKPGTSPETCKKCGGSGQVTVAQQSMFGYIQSRRVCPDCGGRGVIIKEKCSDCRGTGYIQKRQTIPLTIPAGIDNGQSMRVRGKGEPGVNGGERGDLLVEVIVSPHPQFERDGMDIYSHVDVTFPQAALGDTIRIPTVSGDVEYELKPGTQPGTKIRFRGKGAPSLRSQNVRGDHYVIFGIKVPEKMNSEQKEALRAYDDAMKGEPHKTEKKKKGLFGL